MPGALVRTLNKSVRNETSALSLYAPRTMLNQNITGSRRFAAQDWPVERLRAVGRERHHHQRRGARHGQRRDADLPARARRAARHLPDLDGAGRPQRQAVPAASGDGGNAVGSVMVQLGTHLPDPADRLEAIHRSMVDGKDSLSAMTPTQILAMSALGQAPGTSAPIFRMQGIVRPPYNLVVSNVPGPRTTHYWNGARLPAPTRCRSRSTGWRSTSPARPTTARCASASPAAAAPSPPQCPAPQYLDEELAALERAAGVEAVARARRARARCRWCARPRVEHAPRR